MIQGTSTLHCQHLLNCTYSRKSNQTLKHIYATRKETGLISFVDSNCSTGDPGLCILILLSFR